MNFKKVLFLAIFSAALGQNTFSAATEPSQKAEEKTTVTAKKEKTKVRRALEIFGAVAGLAAVITGIVYREQIQSFFTNSNEKPAGDANSNDKPVFVDFITGHGIVPGRSALHIKDYCNNDELALLQKNNAGFVFFVDKQGKNNFINKTQRLYLADQHDDCLTWTELSTASEKVELRNRLGITFDNGNFYKNGSLLVTGEKGCLYYTNPETPAKKMYIDYEGNSCSGYIKLSNNDSSGLVKITDIE